MGEGRCDYRLARASGRLDQAVEQSHVFLLARQDRGADVADFGRRRVVLQRLPSMAVPLSTKRVVSRGHRVGAWTWASHPPIDGYACKVWLTTGRRVEASRSEAKPRGPQRLARNGWIDAR